MLDGTLNLVAVEEMVSAGVGSAGIGEPGHVDGGIGVGAVVGGSCLVAVAVME